MAFRRPTNSHDSWQRIVEKNVDLLKELPAKAIKSEDVFREYVTNGIHNGVRLNPAVDALSSEAIEDLWNFITHKAQFDMDATLFDDFNAAFARKHR